MIDLAHLPDKEDDGDLAKFCAEFGLNEQTAQEILAYTASINAQPFASLDAMRRLEARERQAWACLLKFQSRQSDPVLLRMSPVAMSWVLGHYTVVGVHTVQDIAKKCQVSKQVLNKCMKLFRSKLGIRGLPGQRSAEGCKNMKNGRKKGLKP